MRCNKTVFKKKNLYVFDVVLLPRPLNFGCNITMIRRFLSIMLQESSNQITHGKPILNLHFFRIIILS